MNWFNVSHAGRAEISLFGELGISESADSLIAQVGNADVLAVTVDCNGGFSEPGLKLRDFFASRETHVEILGRCGSSALFAALGAQSITCLPTSRLLVHSATSLVLGDAKELRWEADKLERLNSEIEQLFVARTGQPLATVREWLSKDTWFSAEQALAVGLVDRIAEPSVPTVQADTAPARKAKAPMPESERMFRFWLTSFGPVEATDCDKFLRHLVEWATHNVTTQTK